jgi:hypothetical protein
MQSPTPGSTLGSTAVTFAWNDTGADEYWLAVGTNGAGSGNLRTATVGTSLSATLGNLPHAGETVHARLSSRFGSNWLSRD